MLIAIDIGSGLSKGVFDGCEIKIPSLVGKCSDFNPFMDKGNSFEKVIYKGETFYTGETALTTIKDVDRFKTTTSLWYKSCGNLILHLSLIASAYPQGYKGKVYLVTGLPMKRYKDKSARDKFTSNLVGQHKFQTSNAKYDIEISAENLIVLPQALGLHFNVLKMSQSKVDWETAIVGYIDIGTYTTGFAMVVYNNGSIANSDSVDIGMVHLADGLTEPLKKEFNLEYGEQCQLLKDLQVGKANADVVNQIQTPQLSNHS